MSKMRISEIENTCTIIEIKFIFYYRRAPFIVDDAKFLFVNESAHIYLVPSGSLSIESL